MVDRVVKLYRRLSHEIHHPDVHVVPIKLRFLGPNHGAMMILCCQAYGVKFSLYDEGGARVAWPPPEVARLLGEEWTGKFLE